MGVNGGNPGDNGLVVKSKLAPPPVLIGSPIITPACGISGSLKVGKKRQSTSPDEVSNVDTVVDGKLPDGRYFASVFSKVVGCELSNGSIDDLYLRCRMNFLGNVVQTEAPQLVDLGLPTINTLNYSIVLGTTTNRI